MHVQVGHTSKISFKLFAFSLVSCLTESWCHAPAEVGGKAGTLHPNKPYEN